MRFCIVYDYEFFAGVRLCFETMYKEIDTLLVLRVDYGDGTNQRFHTNKYFGTYQMNLLNTLLTVDALDSAMIENPHLWSESLLTIPSAANSRAKFSALR